MKQLISINLYIIGDFAYDNYCPIYPKGEIGAVYQKNSNEYAVIASLYPSPVPTVGIIKNPFNSPSVNWVNYTDLVFPSHNIEYK